MFLSMAGSTGTHWSKGTEGRESTSHVHSIYTDCSWRSCLLDWLKVFLCVCFYLGRAWICYSWPGRKFRSWTKRRARIFSESLKKKNCNGLFQQWNSGQLKYYSLHVTGSPGTSWCTRGQWTSGPSRPARTTRVTWNFCEGNMDQMIIVP